MVFNYNIVKATTYYVSKSGNDLNSGISLLTPWATLKKINNYQFYAGDSILFRKGDTLYGNLRISQDKLYFGSYGKGNDPVISGLKNVNSWKNKGLNLWESTIRVSTLPDCNMVLINGENCPMGRFPNSGYFTINSHDNNSSITSMDLSGKQNWNGAQIVVRVNRYSIDRNTILSQLGNKLYYKSFDKYYTPSDGFGFFIQNSPLTLDSTNEWYYNSYSGKILIYSRLKPKMVWVSSVDTLVYNNGHNDFTINGINFCGANKIAIANYNSNHVSVINCKIYYSGLIAIDVAKNSNNFLVKKTTICNANKIGINTDSSKNITIQNNIIKNIGVFVGMGSERGSSFGIYCISNFGNISNNTLDSIGYIPVYFSGDDVIIKNNYINTYCFTLDDGGGIYSYSESPQRVWKTRFILGNIVLNGIGAPEGTVKHPRYNNQSAGIYIDASNSNFVIKENLVTNNNKGIFLNNAHEVKIEQNTFYNNQYNLYIRNYNLNVPMSNVTLKKNLFVEWPDTWSSEFDKRTQNIYWLLLPDSLVGKKLPESFKSDSNYYLNSTYPFLIIQNGKVIYKTVPTWKTFTHQEIHSIIFPPLTNDYQPLLFYNPSNSDTTLNLRVKYYDLTGKLYLNSIILKPFSSIVLLKKVNN